jgi:hypothetical protein
VTDSLPIDAADLHHLAAVSTAASPWIAATCVRERSGTRVARRHRMRKIPLGVVSVFVVASVTSACRQEVESTDVETSGLYPLASVVADGSGDTRVRVKLKVGGWASNTFAELTGEDRLTATLGGVSKDLADDGTVTYSATFPGEASGSFVISFLRGADHISAPNTTVTLPAPYAVTVASTEVSRATGALDFTWTPAGSGDIETSLYGDCIDLVLDTIPDDGAATMAGDAIHARRTTDACTATLRLIREQSGELDAAFTEGGEAIARQIRTATFTTTP